MKPDTNTQINLDAGWGLSESLFSKFVEQLSDASPENIVEFGSGGSTARMLKSFPDVKITSFEHDKQWIGYARQQLELEYESRVQLHYAPLQWHKFLGASYLSYSVSSDQLPASADVALIDGPPYSTLRGREACLYIIHSKLVVGGRVFLDDAQRPWETQIIQNWKKTAGHCYTFEMLHGERKNMMMLTKTEDTSLRSDNTVQRDLRACRKEIRKNRIREYLGSWKKWIYQKI